MSKKCFCGSSEAFSTCCSPLLSGKVKAGSALQLMRSRYSAYVTHHIDYLLTTTHVSKRGEFDRDEVGSWARANIWKDLEIVKADENRVEFIAQFRDKMGKLRLHHEKSTFVKEDGIWYYLDGVFNEAI
ncbi:SEC-C motif-containing protein [Dyadobacter jejuensis]|uniref:SEC-C motif-containing protein n=1 Tax=Dyadobacter jejuensis TaxID=1082580 RepID=A0A316AP54_9BACT|nr:YchJ family metal-binding protein [Dyadobacter jejuensis]PWJ58924.1 SEC-C motif-containing protein [Dyadobacter jejuensis]